MIRNSVIPLLVMLACTCSLPASAHAQGRRPPLRPAQPPPTHTHPTFGPSLADRAFVTVGGTFQLGSAGFTSAIEPIDFAERSAIETRYSNGVLPGFDIGGGARIGPRLAVAVNVEHVSNSGSGEVSAQIPHPLFFSRLRPVAGEAPDLHRSETAVHVQGTWIIPMTRNIDIGIGGGPSWIRVAQDLVGDVTVTQTYPYDIATFGGAVANRQTEGRLGVNAGVTVDYRFARRLGIDLNARVSRARVRFDVADAESVAVDAGGTHVGAGLRIRF